MSFAKFLRGALKYKNEIKPAFVKELQKVNKNPKPAGVMFTCMDHRVSPSVFTQCNPGDMFVIRNAGNIVEPDETQTTSKVTTAAGVLDITCLTVGVKHVVICGHSDCKAMHTLAAMKETGLVDKSSAVKTWLYGAGLGSLQAFKKLESENFRNPFEIQLDHPKKILRAHLDTKLEDVDKLSQVNTLIQFKHVSSYKFLHDLLDSGQVKMAAMWFNVNSGDFFMFSEKDEQFVEITENTYDPLLNEHLDN